MPLEPLGPPPAPMYTLNPYGLDEAAFLRMSRLVRRECGITLRNTKSNLIVSRLGKRIRTLELADFNAYLDVVESASGQDELRKMTSLLSTNVTRFFREPHHFEALRKVVLPGLIEKAQAGDKVRIWSAGCSTGEEPLSIAMDILKLCPHATGLDLRILGTDLDPVSIHAARCGIYPALQTDKIPSSDRARFFEPMEEGAFRANDTLRSLVTYAELNLMSPWPMANPFDVIFCRNVVIYFDNATQSALWPRFAEALHPGGLLFVGHSERLSGPGAARFETFGITQYRRV